MGLPEEIWKAIKNARNQPRKLVYAIGKDGKEVKFDLSPRKIPRQTTKHAGSKDGFKPKQGKHGGRRKARFTNHTRVQLQRAAKQNMNLRDYRKKYCK